ncbi:hypothetical protein LSH36_1654g00017 [Paralvinella palmiformis]|uniref:D-serine dehydratase n=1 Tax=Paralvinella palmiformis TaxID=53620 RepID=A0AAD9MQ69_9ANNE|nr:hypothetical protein LSH36_1654g00017 [Paralvinella palmiformis]
MAASDLSEHIRDLPTPCFLLNLKRIKRNADLMIQRCQAFGIKLRPHMKTAKTVEVGLIVTGGSKRRICVSTLAEAEFFTKNGFDDIIYAMLISDSKLPRLKDLAKKLSMLHLLVDNRKHIEMLNACPLSDGKLWSVYLAVDTGSAREGIPWNDNSLTELVELITSSAHLKFSGLYTHEGTASYSVRGSEKVGEVANTTVDRILHIVDRLKKNGIMCDDISIGATPTASLPGNKVKDITEIHPGNFVFYDAQQFTIGSCSEEDIACVVVTRVLGQYPKRNQLLIDAGWSAVSLDGKLANGSYGLFQGQPHLRLVKMHQEYGFVSCDPEKLSVEDFPIGTMLFLYPYHSCATAVLHQQHYVQQDDKVVDIWTPCSQW